MERSKYFDPSYPLTPSELFFNNIQDFKIGQKVSHWGKEWFPSWFGKSDLIPILFVTAFLANEQIGSLRLDTYEKRTFLGLGTRLLTVVSTADIDVSWPQRSLEFELHHIGASSNEDGKNQVLKIVYEWLQPRGSPFGLTFQSVMGHLCERGFVKKMVRKDLGIIPVNEYFPQENLIQLANEQGGKRINKMLEECKRSRPDLWATLLREINEAFTRRKDW